MGKILLQGHMPTLVEVVIRTVDSKLNLHLLIACLNGNDERACYQQ
jgi:hypothetical protein